MRFEYHIETVRQLLSERELNSFGQEGWELVDIVYVPAISGWDLDDNHPHYKHYFKREVTEKHCHG